MTDPPGSDAPPTQKDPAERRLDRLLRRVGLNADSSNLIRESALLAVAGGTGQIGHVVFVALLVRALGLAGLGRYSLVVATVALVGQFFDVRTQAAIITFASRGEEATPEAIGQTVWYGFRIDLLTGALAFLVCLAVAPIVGPRLVGADGGPLIALMAVTLLLSFGDDTSKAVLRVFGRYGMLTGFALLQEALRIGLIVLALSRSDELMSVVAALVAVDLAGAILFPILAGRAFKRELGSSLWAHRRGRGLADRKGILRLVFHTNLIGYAKVAQVRLPLIVLGILHGPAVVGVFRVGMTAAGVTGVVADPPTTAIHPRLARLWAAGARGRIRRLIAEVSAVSVPGMALIAGATILLRDPILRLLASQEVPPAALMVLVYGVLAYAFSGALFWNSPLLLASARGRDLSTISMVGILGIHLPLVLVLSPRYGAAGAAFAFLVATIVNNVWATWRALILLREPLPATAEASEASPPIVSSRKGRSAPPPPP